METEQQAYEVPGSQMRWRAAQLRAQGLPFDTTYNNQSNTYIFFVQQPTGADPFAYQPPPQRSYPVFERERLLRIALILAVAAAICGAGYLIVRSIGGVEAGWRQIDSVRLPWEEAEPEVTAMPAPTATPEAGSFRWPWESAADGLQAARDTADSVQSTVTMAAGAVLAVLVLMIILSLVRRRGR